jgi:hypothetical protein
VTDAIRESNETFRVVLSAATEADDGRQLGDRDDQERRLVPLATRLVAATINPCSEAARTRRDPGLSAGISRLDGTAVRLVVRRESPGPTAAGSWCCCWPRRERS